MSELSVVRLEANGPGGAGLSFWSNMENDNITEGENPKEIGHNFFTDSTGQMTSGVWEATACTMDIESYPVDEFCCVISGEIVIIDEHGKSESFKPGQSFCIPKGLKCTWHMPEVTRKFYVIFDAKPN